MKEIKGKGADLRMSMLKVGICEDFARPDVGLDCIDHNARCDIKSWLDGVATGSTGGIYLYGEHSWECLQLTARALIMRGTSVYVLPASDLFHQDRIEWERYHRAKVVAVARYCGSRRFTLCGPPELQADAEYNLITLASSGRPVLLSGNHPFDAGKEWWDDDVTISMQMKCRSVLCDQPLDYKAGDK